MPYMLNLSDLIARMDGAWRASPPPCSGTPCVGPCDPSYQMAHVLNLGDVVVVELQLGEHVQAVEVVDQRQVLEAVGQAFDVAPGDAAFLVGRMVRVAAQDL